MNRIETEDLHNILKDTAVDWHAFSGKTVVVTGATGLIGSALVRTLLSCSSAKVIAAVRNCERAHTMFADSLASGRALEIILWTAEQPLSVSGPVDYIFHCASQTSSSGFIQTPVETIRTAYMGAEHVLQAAKENDACRVIFLSTMEVYGTPQDDEKITESYVGRIDPLTVRNCYPESKRLCENLCVSYAREYGISVSIARLTQTFGPGVSSSDGRVFAEFARCVLEGKDIVLHTKGGTKRNYLYTADAVLALLIIAQKGKSGEAYNVANEATYCTILEMAELVAENLGNGKVTVRIELGKDAALFGYASVLHMNLDTTKLRALGWTPRVGLLEMYRRMISAFGN